MASRPADLDRPVHIGGAMGLETATIREIVTILRANYCGHVGVEYMHINDVEERRFIQDKIEGRDPRKSSSATMARRPFSTSWSKPNISKNSSAANMSAPSASGSMVPKR